MPPHTLIRTSPWPRSFPFHLPHLFGRPLPGPVVRDKAIARGRAFRRADLHQIFDLESVVAQEPDPVRVREVELDARVARPLHAIDPERPPEQSFGRGLGLVL